MREEAEWEMQRPEAIHLRWKNSTRDEKEAMIEELEKSGWSKDNRVDLTVFFY